MEQFLRRAISMGYSVSVGPMPDPNSSKQKSLVSIIKDTDVMFIEFPRYVDPMVAIRNAFRRDRPNHPIWEIILRERGSLDEAKVKPYMLENVGELTHTALRKLCDSPATTLVYNAIHSLPTPVWNFILDETKKVLKDAMKPIGQPYSRFQLGRFVKSVWQLAIDRFERIEFEKTGKRYAFLDLGKEAEQKLAMSMFDLGCKLMSDEDWIFGVCAYLHEDEDEK